MPAGCNQTQQARCSGEITAQVALFRQWQADVELLPSAGRPRCLADRAARYAA
jgi:hypothetical protein